MLPCYVADYVGCCFLMFPHGLGLHSVSIYLRRDALTCFFIVSVSIPPSYDWGNNDRTANVDIDIDLPDNTVPEERLPPSEVDINWEYAANVENPVHGVGVDHIQQGEYLEPRPPSLATVDADGYVLDTSTNKWLGFLVSHCLLEIPFALPLPKQFFRMLLCFWFSLWFTPVWYIVLLIHSISSILRLILLQPFCIYSSFFHLHNHILSNTDTVCSKMSVMLIICYVDMTTYSRVFRTISLSWLTFYDL